MSKTPNDPSTLTRIYVMKDPETEDIRYVGKTVKTIQRRLREHISAIKRENNHRTNWIKKIVNGGKTPLIEEIDQCRWDESQKRETDWIKYYKDLGYDLVNSTDGGEGNAGWIQKEETIEKRKETIRNKLPKVYQYDINGNFIKEWNSAADAAEELQITTGGIRRCLIGERRFYKDYVWSFNKVEKIDVPERKIVKNNKSTPHSDLAKIIKLEENLMKCENVYLYDKNMNLLYEAISLVDMANYCDKNKISLGNLTSLASKKTAISKYCKTGDVCCNKYIFSYNPPLKHKVRNSAILRLQLIDLFDNIIDEADGLDNFCKKINVPKTNVINNMKGVTKTLTKNNQKFIIKWEIIQNLKEIM